MLQASRLPRKMQRRQFDPVRRQASADIYGGAESTTPATQIEPDVLQVCHVKCNGANSTQFVAKLPLTSMVVQKVPRLPRKSSLMCCKCHACHVKCNGANSTQFVAKLPLTSMVVQKVPHLPRKSSLRC